MHAICSGKKKKLKNKVQQMLNTTWIMYILKLKHSEISPICFISLFQEEHPTTVSALEDKDCLSLGDIQWFIIS